MNKRKQKKKSPKKVKLISGTATNPTPESRAEDAITVAWMLTSFATLAAEGIAYFGWLVIAFVPSSKSWPPEFLALPGLMQFSAMVTGVVSLAMIFLIYRIRKVPPPPSVTMAVIIIGLLPTVTMLFRAMR